ncbi:caveolin-1-like isoform X1 [Mizuhopecten yessoensis]|uniref:Caveolin n=1 Tax=Mizuhopecten yessoensis TaxID=6573 RepID=A0A210QX14_MIZYE|nr:caveolin-1-like isoform X1 [Mizuhopecten yessoensis]OWF53212.1 Caveolin-1 [Mizuhopecten yessoensis]
MDDDDDRGKAKVDLEIRDANEINTHLQVEFEDVFAEPYGTHSVECIWKVTFICYRCTKTCCYNLCAIFTGVFVAFYWGMEFAFLTYTHVWCCTPGMRMFIIQCNQCQKCFGTVINCFLAPVCESCGLFFSNIAVSHHGAPPLPIPEKK